MGSGRFLKKSNMVVGFCLGLLVGIGLVKANVYFDILWLLLLFPLLIIFFRQKTNLFILLLFSVALVIGNYRGHRFENKLEPYSEFSGQKVQIYGLAEVDAQYNDRKQLEFEMGDISFIEPTKLEAPGKIKVSGFGENSVYRGDKLVVSGKLYKTRGSKQASISYADIEIVSKGHSYIDGLRRDFSTGISNVLPDPQAPFGVGLLIGQKSTLGSEATSWLSAVGLTHIIAVSGYNLTIIVRFVHRIFGNRSRYQTLIFSSLIVCLFLLVTGFSASIVRASIVCALSLVAWYYGRKIKPKVILLLTASITAVWYPVYLWSDIGWYLSFLAFFGVMVVAPLITRRIFKTKPKPIISALIETICAQLMTAPLIMYIFSEVSTVSIISNLLVVSLVPLAMIFTLLAGAAGMINPVNLYVLAIPAKLLLSYILYVSYIFSRSNNSLLKVEISLPYMLSIYSIIFVVTAVVWDKTRGQRDIITDDRLL